MSVILFRIQTRVNTDDASKRNETKCTSTLMINWQWVIIISELDILILIPFLCVSPWNICLDHQQKIIMIGHDKPNDGWFVNK